jgi:aminoglycoside phosphotransferase (APT) family kinase protein
VLSRDDARLARRDPGLPGLATLLDADAFAAELGRLAPEAEVRGAIPAYVRYKPGTNALLAYDVLTAWGVVPVYAKTFRPDAGPQISRPRGRPGRPGPLGLGVTSLAGCCAVVREFPNDPRLPALAVLDRVTVRPGRGDIVEAAPGTPPGRLVPLRYKPERRWVGRHDGTWDATPLVLKAYAPSRFGSAVAGATAFREGEVLRPAVPVARSEPLGLLAFRWVEGALLSDRLEAPDLSLSLVERAGQALAELHAQPARALPRLSRSREAAELGALAESVAGLAPRVAGCVRRLAGRLAERLLALPEEAVAIHGDFYAKQLVLADGAVAVLDLDRSALGDPARDAGLFLAHLERDRLRGRLGAAQAARIGRAFLAGYRRAAGALPGHLDLYTAIGLLHLAPDPFRHREPDWAERIEALVARAAARPADGVPV